MNEDLKEELTLSEHCKEFIFDTLEKRPKPGKAPAQNPSNLTVNRIYAPQPVKSEQKARNMSVSIIKKSAIHPPRAGANNQLYGKVKKLKNPTSQSPNVQRIKASKNPETIKSFD